MARLVRWATALALPAALCVAGVPVRAAEPWVSNGPDIAWVTTLLRPQGPQGALLAGTFGGGVFISRDAGEHWQRALPAGGGRFIQALAADTRAIPFVFAGTAERGLWRSQPPDFQWAGVNAGLGGDAGAPEITGISVSPDDFNLVLISTADGMRISKNQGGSWADSLSWLGGFYMSDAEIPRGAPHLAYGTGVGAVYWTPSRGHRVFTYNAGLPDAFFQTMAFWPFSLDTLVVGAYSSGVYVTEHAQSAAPFHYAGLVPEGQPHPIVRTLEVASDAGLLLLGTELGAHTSDDLGAHWVQLDDGLGLAKAEVWAVLAESATPLRLDLGTFTRGFLRSADGGGQWIPCNDGMRAGWISGLWAWDDSILASTRHGRMYLSPDAGHGWLDRTGDLNTLGLNAVIRLRGTERWLTDTVSNVVYTDDQGSSWHETDGIPAGMPVFAFLQPAWLDPAIVYACTYVGVYRSVDTGETWSLVPNGSHSSAPSFALASAPADSSIWFTVDQVDVFAGKDGGPFVAQNMKPTPAPSYTALSIPDGTRARVVVGTGNSLTVYEDGAARDAGTGLPSRDVNAFAYVAQTGDLYVGLDSHGVWRSPDLGRQWHAFNDGLEVPQVTALAVTTASIARVHAGTLGASVASRDADDLVAVLLDGPRLTRLPEGVEVAFAWQAPKRAGAAGAGDAEWGAPAATTTAAAWWQIDRAEDSGPWLHLADAGGDGSIRYVDALEGVTARPGRLLRYRVQVAQGAQVIATALGEIVLDPPAATLHLTQLLPNAPNPFNPQTSVRFVLGRAGPATVEVLDARGRRVAQIWQGRLEAGEHVLTWNGSDDRGRPLASGAYLLRLLADGRAQTRVISLIR